MSHLLLKRMCSLSNNYLINYKIINSSFFVRIEEVDEQKSRGSFLEELTQTPQFKPQFVESIPVDTMSQTQSQYLTETKSTTNSTLTNKKAPPKRFTGKKFSEPSSMNHTMPVSSKPDPSTFSYDDRSEKKELPIHLKFKQIDAEAKKLEDSIVKAPNAAQSLLKVYETNLNVNNEWLVLSNFIFFFFK